MKIFLVHETDLHLCEDTGRVFPFTTKTLAEQAITLLIPKDCKSDREFDYEIREYKCDEFPRYLHKGFYWDKGFYWVLSFCNSVIGYKGSNSYKSFGWSNHYYSCYDVTEPDFELKDVYHQDVKIIHLVNEIEVRLWAKTRNEAIAIAEEALLNYESKDDVLKDKIQKLLNSGYSHTQISQVLDGLKK